MSVTALDRNLSHLAAARPASATAAAMPAAGLLNACVALEELREFAELRFRAADKGLLSRVALERLASARVANLTSRSRSLRAMAGENEGMR